MVNHGEPAGRLADRPPRKFLFFKLGSWKGMDMHAVAPYPSKSVSRIPVNKSTILNGQNEILTYPGVRLRVNIEFT